MTDQDRTGGGRGLLGRGSRERTRGEVGDRLLAQLARLGDLRRIGRSTARASSRERDDDQRGEPHIERRRPRERSGHERAPAPRTS